MNRTSIIMIQRNKAIRIRFWELQQRMPRMMAYAQVAEENSLTEDRVRQIVKARH